MFDLLNEISELVYIADLDTYDLLFMNTTGMRHFGLTSLEGLKCYSTLQHRDQPCEFCTNRFLKQDCFYSWEITNGHSGRHFLLKDKLVEWKDKLVRLEIAFDMTEPERQKMALQNSLDAETLVLDCVKVLHTALKLPHALDVILEKIGVYLEADRAYIFEIRDGLMSNTHEWCAPGTAAQIGLLQNLPVPMEEQLETSFQDSQCLRMDSLESLREKHPDEYEDLREQGIERLLAVPLELDGTLLGYIGVDNPPAEKTENISSLLNTLGYFISSSIRRHNDKLMLDTLIYYDTLTGALNRNAFVRDLEAFMTLPESVGVVCVDINGMKEINDRHGHPYGDRILVKVAEQLTALFGPACLYRSGGDEFVVICRSISEIDLEARVRELRYLISSSLECQASLGYRWAEECSGLQRILFEADEIMYADKKAFYHGKAGLRYRHNNDDILGLTQPGALQQMLADNRFMVYFQPKFSVYSNRQIGAEALIRLRTAADAIVVPNQFIPVLEQSRLISTIDFYVFDRVCHHLSRWRQQGRPVVPISVNFSRHSLSEANFPQRLLEIWHKYNIPKELLEIEVTESVEADDSYNFLRVIGEIRKAGFAVSIDDFGVRHANLSLFTSIDFDVLKIDRSLVVQITENLKARAIVQSVAEICHRTGIRIIAEGVETEAQAQALRDLNCAGAQGYLFSRPIPRKEYEDKFLKMEP